MATSARIDELQSKFAENPRRYFAPLANEYRKIGDLDHAIQICEEYLPQQPGHMSGHIVYGQSLFEAARVDEARAVFETALVLDPENLIALRHLGDIARQFGEFEAARGWYRRVLDADPRNEEISALLASLPEVTTAPLPYIESTVSEATPAGEFEAVGAGQSTTGGSPSAPDLPSIDDATPAAPLVAVSADDTTPVHPVLAVIDDTTPVHPVAAIGADDETTPVHPIEAVSADVSHHAAHPPIEALIGSVPDAPTELPLQARLDRHDDDLLPSDIIREGDHTLTPPRSGFAVEGQELVLQSAADAPHSAGFERTAELTSDLVSQLTSADTLDLSDARIEDAPVDAPTETPVEARAEAPLDAHVEIPVAAPVEAQLEPTAGVVPELPPAPASEPATALPPMGGFVLDSVDLVDFTPITPIPAIPESPIVAESQETPAAAEVSAQARGAAETPTEFVSSVELPPESAPIDGGHDGQEVPAAATEVFVTETMAELYLRQGHLESALEIYRRLVAQRPSETGLRDRLRAVEELLYGPPTPAEPTAAAPSAPSGPTIREFLSGLFTRGNAAAATGNGSAGSGEPSDPSSAPSAAAGSGEGPIDALFGSTAGGEPDVAAASVLADAFSDEEAAAPPSGLPAHRAATDLSLDHVFRSTTPARGTDAGAGFSFDQFFAEEAKGATPQPNAEPLPGPTDSAEEIAQFNRWLNGLKKT